MTSIDYKPLLTSDEPYKPLTKKISAASGRNNRGVICVRHQSGGNKKLYRLVDFRQTRFDVPAKIETVEYDPYRNAFISRVIYKDGKRSYILAAKDLKIGDEIVTSKSAALKIGNRTSLKNVPIGYQVFNIEMRPGDGGKLARSAGSYAEVLAHEEGMSTLRLGSKEVRKVPWDGLATIGQASNPDYNLVNIGKAGRSRWLGIRPTVRGTAMNPCDHPYGGGEGRQPRGTRRPKTMWGKITGGRKTRKRRKWSDNLIIQRKLKVR
jgi:large subunit ribosomal protein L2